MVSLDHMVSWCPPPLVVVPMVHGHVHWITRDAWLHVGIAILTHSVGLQGLSGHVSHYVYT